MDPAVKSGSADLFASIKGAQEFREGKAKQVSGVTVWTRYTVQVVLTEALVPFVSVLAVGHAKIVPKEVVEQQGEAFGAHPIGTGPFKFVRWERAKEIVLVANPDYFDGPPKLSRVLYRIFRGEEFDAMYEQFERGNLEDTPIPTQGVPPGPSHGPLRPCQASDVQREVLRTQHANQAAGRPTGAAGSHLCHRPGGPGRRSVP